MNGLVDNLKNRLRITKPVDYTAERISGEVPSQEYKKKFVKNTRTKQQKQLRRSFDTETKYLDSPLSIKEENFDTVSLQSSDSTSFQERLSEYSYKDRLKEFKDMAFKVQEDSMIKLSEEYKDSTTSKERRIEIKDKLHKDGNSEKFFEALVDKYLVLNERVKQVNSGETTTTKPFTFDKDIPVFGGTQKEDYGQWNFLIQMDITSKNVDDLAAGVSIFSKLKGTPLQEYRKWYEGLADKKDAKLTEFKKILDEKYDKVTCSYINRRTLHKLQMRDFNSLSEYDDEFMKIASGIAKMTEEELVVVYENGLEEDMKVEFNRHIPIQTLREAMRISRSIELNRNVAKPRSLNYASSSRGNFRYRESKKQKFNRNVEAQHYKPSAPEPPPRYNKVNSRGGNNSRIKGNCFNCGRQGHRSVDCRLPKRVNNVENVDDDDIKKCCVAMTNKHGLFGITSLIEGTEIKSYFDTGAEISIMNTETAEKLKISLKDTSTTIMVANNQIVKPKGETGDLRIEIGESSTYINFIVMNHESHPILLGTDWILKTQARIDLYGQSVTFPRRTVYAQNAVVIKENLTDMIQDGRDETDLLESGDEIEELGINPFEEEEIVIEPTTKLSGGLLETWEKEVKPAIYDRCSKGVKDMGRFTGDQMNIELTSQLPVSRPSFRKSITEMEEIEQLNQELLVANIIEPSTSAYNNPIMTVGKKDGSKRIVNDFRFLNEIMYPLNFTIPRTSDIFTELSGANYISSTDFPKGFFQCPLNESCRKYTAYSTRRGHWQYKVCPQGVKVGPAWFSLCVGQAMLKCKGFALNYFDDLIIYSKTLSEHLKHIILVMEALKQYGFKVSAKKSHWICREIVLLGFVVSGYEVKIDPKKIETIKSRPIPINSKQVESACGLFQYFSKWCKDFSIYLQPLREAVIEFKWSEKQQKSWDHFINLITSAPVLVQYQADLPVIGYSDGCKEAIGGMLCHIIDEKEHVIEYCSRKLKGAELNYGITDIEMLAINFCVRKWRNYIYGKEVVWYTDHKALIHVMASKQIQSGRLGRSVIFLQPFNLDIRYIPGKENTAADFASRPPTEAKAVMAILTRNSAQQKDKNDRQLEDISYKNHDVYDDPSLLHYIMYGKHLDGIPKKQVKRIEKLHGKYKYEDNKIFIIHQDKWKEVPPMESRRKLIEENHLLGHFMSETTINRVEEDYYWKSMQRDIDSFVDRCLTCQRHSNFTPIEHPAKAIQPGRMFEIIQMDMVSGLPETVDKYCKILVITQKLTKAVKIYAMKSKEMQEVATNFWHYCCIYGPAKVIITDQGKEFINQMIDRFIELTGMERRITSAYNPRTNGQAEKSNDTIITVLRKTAETNTRDWDKYLPFVEYCYNTRKHSTTGFSPFELLHGVKANKYVNYKEDESKADEESLILRATEIKKLVENTRKEATENIAKQQIIQKNIQNKRNKITEKPLKVGTRVMLKTEGMRGKLEAKFHGRFKIKEVTDGGNYRLENAKGELLKGSYPVTKLRPIVENNSNDNSQEVERILDKRKNRKTDTIEYLIKWKDFDDSENEWISEELFDGVELINSYNNTIHRKDQAEFTSPVEKPKKKRGPKGPWKHKGLPSIITLLLILFNVLVIQAKKKTNATFIHEKFHHCEKSKVRIVENEFTCAHHEKRHSKSFEEFDNLKLNYSSFTTYKPWDYSAQKVPEQYVRGFMEYQRHYMDAKKAGKFLFTTPLHILKKMDDEINGPGYECSIFIEKAVLETNIIGYKYPPVVTQRLEKVSHERCWQLVRDKLCNKEALNCDDSHCVSKEPNLEEKYGWYFTRKVVEYEKCSYKNITIVGEHKYEDVLRKGCIVDREYCEMAESIIVWKKADVVNNCPFQMIAEYRQFFRIESNIIQENGDKLVFQIADTVKICISNTLSYRTTSNLYLIKPDYRYSIVTDIKLDKDFETNTKLMEASWDYERVTELQVHTEITKRQCDSLHNSFELAKMVVHDEFVHIRQPDGENLITYISNGNIYIPKCSKEIDIEVIHQEVIVSKKTICFEDIPIIWFQGNKNGTGFITKNKIIIKESKRIDCNGDIERYITVERAKRAIVRERRLNTIAVSVIDNTKSKIKVHSFNNIENLNFKHFQISERDHNVKVKSLWLQNHKYSYSDMIDTQESSIEHQVDKTFMKIKNNWIAIKTSITSVVAGIIVIFFIITLFKILSCCRVSKRSNFIGRDILPPSDEAEENLRKFKEEDLDSVTMEILKNSIIEKRRRL